MNKRYFIIYFWGTKDVTTAHKSPPAVDVLETQFYSNMDCTTDGEYPSCEDITNAGKEITKAKKLIILNISELNKKDFDDWNKKQPPVKG